MIISDIKCLYETSNKKGINRRLEKYKAQSIKRHRWYLGRMGTTKNQPKPI